MNKRKYRVNDSFFETIDTEEKAYWLGFISADGCVYIKKNSGSRILEISLNIKDVNHLVKFNKCLDSNYPIIQNTNSCRVSIVSRKIFQDLLKLGVTERKSKTLIPPTEQLIPPNLMFHYIRGYFDGDGGFTTHDKYLTYAVNFCGTPQVCEFILSQLNKQNLRLINKKDVESFAQIRIKGNKQSLDVANKLYNNATIYLDRKFKQYQDLILLNEINQCIDEINKLEFKIKSLHMVEMLRKGYTGKDIAKHFDCGEANITRYVKKYRTALSKDKEKQVLGLFHDGITNKSEIHRIIGFSRDYIRKVLNKVN
ncbi:MULTISPECIES: helix-turn-helix domain-containing protein [Bacillus]|uniref:DOD-type homing endonuclease domain-containing protein n=1 Tax=Bacillus sonorensis TaxID=119858 RepID=A0ABN5AEQ8_9BACI|nr:MULTISPECIES: helix-turn-helix domain-containing protein [Bacillus]ASB89277.1 hypothetical protein S101395_02770 [Bacillus sonorensis]MEC0338405.1 helix-turn-helix domain-containing protein [Bacillus sonorensis]MEC0425262.1 helix-turn-helix domain-containing protein [Bacillus sonorensis]MEC0460816.1 helix-turn-helix domain-containing protein [Bacillus sonorensis]MEC0497268.1 helix-turn-helix domain-containing protein [Bacillus glycinifermentans]